MPDAHREEHRPSAPFRIAAVGDLHCTKTSAGAFASWLETVNQRADALVLCGDLTDYGLVEEAQVLVRELAVVRVPVLAVLGNHDYQSGAQDEVSAALREAGIRVLAGESSVVQDCGFVGTKGFAGGFGSYTLGFWGEPVTKRFVQEAVDEALLLESALARLRTRRRFTVLHYSPIQATVEGEPVPIHPFLGCSRLEEPLLRYPVDAIFHGHAHRGSPEGRTRNGVPVYNVALPLLRSRRPDLPPYRLFDVSDFPPRQTEEPHAAPPDKLHPFPEADAARE